MWRNIGLVDTADIIVQTICGEDTISLGQSQKMSQQIEEQRILVRDYDRLPAAFQEIVSE